MTFNSRRSFTCGLHSSGAAIGQHQLVVCVGFVLDSPTLKGAKMRECATVFEGSSANECVWMMPFSANCVRAGVGCREGVVQKTVVSQREHIEQMYRKPSPP
eukprot:4684902-Amphidinium_carterae.4